MLRKKSLAIGAVALLASAATLQPALAQYQPYDPYDPYAQQYNQYQNQNQYYDQQQSQYERDRAYYERQYNNYQYQQPYQQPYYGTQPYQPYQAYPTQPYYGQGQYRVQDDPYYRECRPSGGNQVAGLIIGGLAGAALGSTIARGPSRGPGTAIGAILGGALGASIAGNTNTLDCEDRRYVYTTYYDGFERGIPRRTYRWRNARTGNYGTFYVGDYYRGPQGYRCANYTQTIWVRGRPVPANGYACRQPDGNWVIMN
jgi:surface antigen